ncbi:DNA helicase [Skeletonema marinoi]|uniref:DNA helicase n=1 Tax=Skeletonema marinoi TaxID=267567 RepID=A0AAD8XVC6_9STRA|nr:DNA helicase [Skeletonema marinoi]
MILFFLSIAAILLSSCCVHSLLLPRSTNNILLHHQSSLFRTKSCIAVASSNHQQSDVQTPSPSSYHRLIDYASHWTQLLQLEHKEQADEIKHKRSTWSVSRLESAGISLFNVCAEPDGEMYGEKIIRLFYHNDRGDESSVDQSTTNNGRKGIKRKTNWREKFNRGDVLIITPQESFRGKDPYPKEGLVTDVGTNYISVGVGASYPVGLFEMRKHSGRYMVRVDRSAPNAPLKAQRLALDKLRLGKSVVGSAAVTLVESYHKGVLAGDDKKRTARKSNDVTWFSDVPRHFDGHADDLQEHIMSAIKKAGESTTFEPNESQRKAVLFALSRSVGLIRGPPGTGKTRVASLLISTALKMKVNRKSSPHSTEDDDTEQQPEHPRVLAVTHSNGAADVLLQALLDMGVPAVRHGRPASVSPSVQHRTIVALSDRMPEVIRLRQIANDPSGDLQDRQSAGYDIKQYTNDVQTMIMRTAPVVVTSCISAQQMLSDDSAAFPIVVLDEAAQTTEPALMCALTAAGADQLIMVGDTKQLPPTVTSQNVELRKSIGISPMERLMKNGAEEFVLKEQYRMPAALLKHPNEHFYDSMVKCATESNNETPNPKGFPWPNQIEPLAFLQVGNDSEVTHNFGGRSNPKEADVIIHIVLKLISAGDVRAENIAIITPYSKQVQLLRAELNSASIIHHGLGLSDIQVGSVDSFQGQEKELVLFSAVRSNLLNELGFLRDARRLNVAITRAKRGLIVVGDSAVLKSCRHWAALLNSCNERGCRLTEREYYCEVETRAETRVTAESDLSEFELDMEDEFFGLFSD